MIVKRYQYVLTGICVVLMVLLFLGMGVAADTGDLSWFIGVAIFDYAAVIGFAFFAPERWRD